LFCDIRDIYCLSTLSFSDIYCLSTLSFFWH
jgi:hypothetical protein